MNHEFNPGGIFASLENAAEEMAGALYIFRRLDKLEKPLLADLMLKADGKSIAERDAKARASEEYKQHVEGLCVAERDYIRARAKYNDLGVLAELRRTEESSRRKLT